MQRLHARLMLTAPFVVAAASPSPSQARAGLRADGADALVAVVAIAAWACVGWLVLIALLTALEGLGVWSRAAGRLLRVLAPVTIRNTAKLAIGITVTAGLGGPSAWADPLPPPLAATAPSSGGVVIPNAPDFDWPRAGGPTFGTSIERPSETPAPRAPVLGPPVPNRRLVQAAAPRFRGTPPEPAARRQPPLLPTTIRPGSAPDPVTVRPGDSLWAIAGRALGPSATPARIAQSWPTWWSANRHVIGSDPDLLQPGTRLLPPGT